MLLFYGINKISWGKEINKRLVEHFISFLQLNNTGMQMSDSIYHMIVNTYEIACFVRAR